MFFFPFKISIYIFHCGVTALNTDFAGNIPKIGLKEHDQKKKLLNTLEIITEQYLVLIFVFYQQKKKNKTNLCVYTELLTIHFFISKKKYIQLLCYMACTLLVHLTQVFSI